MDQFFKTKRHTSGQKQAGKTIAVSIAFLTTMAVLMSFGNVEVTKANKMTDGDIERSVFQSESLG